MPRCALGYQGIHLVTATAEKVAELDRAVLRAKVEAASVRPTPGTSDLLGRPLRVDALPGVTSGMFGGLRLQMVESHDLLALAPIHLKKDNPNE